MKSHFSFGRHTATTDGNGILFIKYQGFISLQDMEELRRIVEIVTQTTAPVFLLSNLGQAGAMNAEARRFTSQWLATAPVAGGANFGATAFTRAAGELIASLLRLIHVAKVPFTFVNTEAEARAWIDKQRVATARRGQ